MESERTDKMTEIIDYRLIASDYFKKEILPDEMVHHIDGNHNNNDPENLVIMKKTQHSKVHVLFNFENWQNRRVLCKTCLFVEWYDGKHFGFSNGHTIETRSYEELYDVADLLITNIRRDTKTIDILYKVSKEWKEENDHDCYKHKHLEVVRHV